MGSYQVQDLTAFWKEHLWLQLLQLLQGIFERVSSSSLPAVLPFIASEKSIAGHSRKIHKVEYMPLFEIPLEEGLQYRQALSSRLLLQLPQEGTEFALELINRSKRNTFISRFLLIFILSIFCFYGILSF